MTRMLLTLAIVSASKATQAAFDTAKAAGYPTVAAHLHQAGQLIASAMGLLIVDAATNARTS